MSLGCIACFTEVTKMMSMIFSVISEVYLGARQTFMMKIHCTKNEVFHEGFLQ